MKTVFDSINIGGHYSSESIPFEPAPASEPTDAMPGSPERIAAMRRRAERGEDLYHEDDRQCVDGSKMDREIYWSSYSDSTFRDLRDVPEFQIQDSY